MSAELMAEFGQPNSPLAADNEKMRGVSSTPRHDSEALVPNVLRGSDRAVLAEKMENRLGNIWHGNGNGADVLFDASTAPVEIDDDFGDFEVGEQVVSQQGRTSSSLNDATSTAPSLAPPLQYQTLLDLEGSMESAQSSTNRQSQDHDVEWGDLSVAGSKDKPSQENIGVPIEAPANNQALAIEDMKELETWEPLKDDKTPANFTLHTYNAQRPISCGIYRSASQPKALSGDVSSIEGAPAVPAKDEGRATNVPPPAILLQILPTVFSNLISIRPTHGLTQYCNDVLRAYTVAGHIIAGRKLRWKRDKILSQGCKMGPAAAGRSGGGMKLAAIDKTENLKEEREVAYVLEAWERHAHVFNSVVHEAGIRRSLMTLSEKSRPCLSEEAGVVTSRHACALCGLKREERVPELKIVFFDSFGEFWIEHWGHKSCKDFWRQIQGLLPQR